MRKVLTACCTGLVLLALTAGMALADANWPKKPVVIVCGYSAGGGTDLLFRSMVPGFKKIWDQTVTVVNKTGAGGAIGFAAGALEKPDGYNIVNATTDIVIYPYTMPGVQFKTDDFRPVVNFNTDYGTITVPKEAPYNTIEEFIAYCKKNPGKVSIGNSGLGGVWHFVAANFAKTVGVELNHIPFEGGGAAVTALAGGHLDSVPMGASEIDAQLKAGRVKVLCVLAPNRLKSLPDVPTLAESGYKGPSLGVWRGFAVPKGTPDAVVAAIEAAGKTVFESQEVTAFMDNLKYNRDFLTAAEYEKRWKEETAIYGELAKELGF